MKALKNTKGMTLIEVIVGMLLFIIIITTTSAVLAPMLTVYIKANELAECNTLLDNIANQMISDLSTASCKLEIFEDNKLSITVDTPNDVRYSVDSDGVLLRNEIPVFSKHYYKDKGVGFSCAASASETAYTLTVIINSDKNGEMIHRDYVVKPIAINQY